MKKVIWDLPFKTMHYLESLTEELSTLSPVRLITGIQTPEGEIKQANIFLKDIEEAEETALVHLGVIMGRHSAEYATRMEESIAEVDFIETILDKITEAEIKLDSAPIIMHEGVTNIEVEIIDGVIHISPTVEDLFEKAEKETQEVPEPVIKEEVEEEVEEVEEAIKEIVEIKETATKGTKTLKKDNKFIAKLRVILTNFKK